MKKLLSLIAVVVLLIGCTATQQKATFNTLYSVEHTTTAAVDAYFGLVVRGEVSTNGVKRVATSYNNFQASFLIALDAAQFHTNALAPESLIIESQDIINLITTLKGQ